MNTAQKLLAALIPTTSTVDVDGFGPLCIKQLTVAENDVVRASVQKDAAASEFGLRLLVAAVVDDANTPIFTAADLPSLQASSGAKIDGLIKKVLEINGFKGTDEKNAQS